MLTSFMRGVLTGNCLPSSVYAFDDWVRYLVLVRDIGLEVSLYWKHYLLDMLMSIRTSALVGMLVMVLSFPLPGYVAKVIQSVQITRMKKVSVF
jgi:hypothetical protein